jgi:dihydroorotate dehydrogenase electron transfer subunit
MLKKDISDYDVIITKNDKINENYYLLGVGRPPNFDIVAGQFVNIKIEPQSIQPFLRRPFSVFYLDKYEIGILYQIKGEGTKLLSTKKNGTKLKMIGPLGTSFPLEESFIKNIDGIFLIAGGIGIAPLFFYANRIKSKYEYLDINLVYGIRDESFLLPEDYIKYYFSSIFFTIEKKAIYDENIYSGCNCKYFSGNIFSALNSFDFDSLVKKYKNPLFAVCGPDPMLKAFIEWNKDKSFESYLSLESFMGCGFHACLGCAVPKSSGGYIYICEEGPVVYYKDINLQ